jgi:acyl carrier protein
MISRNAVLVSSLVASVLDLHETAISPESSMENVPAWDSLAQLNICLAFQERFNLVLDMETIANSTSVVKLAMLLPN